MTNAERQARWRARRKAELDELRRGGKPTAKDARGPAEWEPERARLLARIKALEAAEVARLKLATTSAAKPAPVGELTLDWNSMPGSQRAKLEAFQRQIKRKLDREYDQRRTAEIVAYLDGYLLPLYREKISEYEAVVKARKGVMSLKQWELIRNCVHPDDSASKETRNRAFQLWMSEKLKLVVVAEKQSSTRSAPPLPKTAAEWMARKAEADAERRAARAKAKAGGVQKARPARDEG